MVSKGEAMNAIEAVLCKFENIPDYILSALAHDIDSRLSEFYERQSKCAEELFGASLKPATTPAVAKAKPKAVKLTGKQKAWLTRRQNQTREMYSRLLNELETKPWEQGEKALLEAMDEAQTVNARSEPYRVASAVTQVAKHVRAIKSRNGTLRPLVDQITRAWGIK